MSNVPNLLNDDGTASMATMLLMSHHAFRRDLARFLRAIGEIKAGDTARIDAVREEWEKSYREALHGHHTMEDSTIFPDIQNKHPDLVTALEQLTAQHHEIDPLLERVSASLGDLAQGESTEVTLNELKKLLDNHLSFEEAQITPSLREAKDFPVPADEQMALMYAQGFAWSMQGIAPSVLTEVEKLLPAILLAKLPAARTEFEARSKRVWGTYSVGSAVTPIPEVY